MELITLVMLDPNSPLWPDTEPDPRHRPSANRSISATLGRALGHITNAVTTLLARRSSQHEPRRQ